VYSCHKPALYTEIFKKYFGNRGETVSGAGSIGDNIMLPGVIGV